MHNQAPAAKRSVDQPPQVLAVYSGRDASAARTRRLTDRAPRVDPHMVANHHGPVDHKPLDIGPNQTPEIPTHNTAPCAPTAS
ncbi:hypothetical protein GCM10009838_68010 [Catenulispora subtropica]|uniref:Uncharacterized protein n=1 Tax=Catenulispora subtropica TaxID=450798 RepID=A0ABN2SX73_9ACTN